MPKIMIDFLKKFQNRSIKIGAVNSILITKSINLDLFTLIFYDFGVRCDLRRFSVFSPFIEKSICMISANKEIDSNVFIFSLPMQYKR